MTCEGCERLCSRNMLVHGKSNVWVLLGYYCVRDLVYCGDCFRYPKLLALEGTRRCGFFKPVSRHSRKPVCEQLFFGRQSV